MMAGFVSMPVPSSVTLGVTDLGIHASPYAQIICRNCHHVRLFAWIPILKAHGG